MKYKVYIITMLIFCNNVFAQDNIGAFGVKLGHQIEINDNNLEKKSEFEYSFIPKNQYKSDIFSNYNLLISPLSHVIIAISANKKEIHNSVCISQKEKIENLLENKYHFKYKKEEDKISTYTTFFENENSKYIINKSDEIFRQLGKMITISCEKTNSPYINNIVIVYMDTNLVNIAEFELNSLKKIDDKF